MMRGALVGYPQGAGKLRLLPAPDTKRYAVRGCLVNGRPLLLPAALPNAWQDLLLGNGCLVGEIAQAWQYPVRGNSGFGRLAW